MKTTRRTNSVRKNTKKPVDPEKKISTLRDGPGKRKTPVYPPKTQQTRPNTPAPLIQSSETRTKPKLQAYTSRKSTEPTQESFEYEKLYSKILQLETNITAIKHATQDSKRFLEGAVREIIGKINSLLEHLPVPEIEPFFGEDEETNDLIDSDDEQTIPNPVQEQENEEEEEDKGEPTETIPVANNQTQSQKDLDNVVSKTPSGE